MRALFVNGVFESVLEEILRVQRELPEHVMYLQPHAADRIVGLHKEPPTPEVPVLLYASTTTDLSLVSYTAEVVGYDDKRTFKDNPAKEAVLNRVIWTLQPEEQGLYRQRKDGKEFANLLHVRRTRRLGHPFPVSDLLNVKDDQPLSMNRTSAGKWVYVHPREFQP